MIINGIKIENFQCYHGVQTMRFSRGLNLIIGKGGKGKSKLFNAFYWALFGKLYITEVGWVETDTLPSSSRMQVRRHDFINAMSLYNAQPHDIIETSVRIDISDENGIPYTIERKVRAERLETPYDWRSDAAWSVSNSSLNISQNRIPLLDSESEIERLFPSGIRKYIWFQGESLKSLINLRDKKTLKDAVEHISYYPYYERMYDIINKAISKIEFLEGNALQEANSDKKIADALKHISEYRQQIDDLNEKKDQLEKDAEEIKSVIDNCNAKIKACDTYKKLVIDIKETQDKLKDVQTELTNLREQRDDLLSNSWILRGTTPMIEGCLQMIENYRDSTSTDIDEEELKQILYQGRCSVCGSHIRPQSEEYDYILDKLRSMNSRTNTKNFDMLLGTIEDNAKKISKSVSNIDEEYKTLISRINETADSLYNLRQKERTLNDKKLDIERQYGQNFLKEQNNEYNDALKNREQKQKEYAELRKKERKVKDDIEKTEYRLAKAQEEYERQKMKGKVAEVNETKWREISVFLSEVCRDVKDNAHLTLLRRIEERANEIYNAFTKYDNGYKGEIIIKEDYTIKTVSGINTSHEDRQKMSIINAILSLNQEALGIYYPFISDAPTSNFDSVTTKNYMMGIKEIFEQSIIMTKDVDIDGEIYKQMMNDDHVATIYELRSKTKFDNDTSLLLSLNPELHQVSTEIVSLKF